MEIQAKVLPMGVGWVWRALWFLLRVDPGDRFVINQGMGSNQG